VLKLLGENLGKKYRLTDIEDITGFPNSVLCSTLNDLGSSGIIEFDSPSREKKGKRQGRYAEYWLADPALLQMDIQELYDNIRDRIYWFETKGYLEKVLNHIKNHPDKTYEYQSLSSELNVEKNYVSTILSQLKELGYLDSRFSGKIQSEAKGNDNTILLKKALIDPIEAVAEGLDPRDYRGFYDKLEFYNLHPKKRVREVQNMLRVYDRERTRRGPEGSEELASLLIGLPQESLKLSDIIERFNDGRMDKRSRDAFENHLELLISLGYFEKPKRGYYRRTAKTDLIDLVL